MRCEQCGRAIRNAEMWQLSGTRNVPAARSMLTLCRDCRQASPPPSASRGARQALEEAEAIIRRNQRPA
jgi:ribosome-binding protein aMBF1 (putative translation factor)